MSENQKALAAIHTRLAIDRASRGPVVPPTERVMSALAEAVKSKGAEVEALVIAGRIDSDRYRTSKDQLVS